jgi:hypothetical protein
MSGEVVKFPPPKRYNVEDQMDDQGNWTKWEIIEVTGNEAIVYIEGEDDPWAGESLDKIMANALNYEYGHSDSDAEEITRVNHLIYDQAIKLRHNIKG